MIKERKIALVANKVSFEEAEINDDIFWSNASCVERLNGLFELRKMQYGTKFKTMKKVVFKRAIHEEEAN